MSAGLKASPSPASSLPPERACLANQLGLGSNDPCLPLLEDMLQSLPLSWTASFDGQRW